MPITSDPLFNFSDGLNFTFKIGFLIFAVLYFIFTLILVRQTKSMSETIITEGGPILRGLAILFAGLSLGVIILFIGFL